jgi:hypothetical protein
LSSTPAKGIRKEQSNPGNEERHQRLAKNIKYGGEETIDAAVSQESKQQQQQRKSGKY